jgi:integrase
MNFGPMVMKQDTVVKATHMLAAVLEQRSTYRQAGQDFQIGHSTVERQVKSLLTIVAREQGIPGIDDPTLTSLALLRHRAADVMTAVRAFEPGANVVPPPARVDLHDLDAAIGRLRRRTQHPNRDAALLYVLFCTGAKPLEIARLQVSDYLLADGSVRAHSSLRPEAAARGHARPLYFESARACAAIDAYLDERRRRRLGTGTAERYRGLDPHSALFLTERGRGFEVRERSATDARATSPLLIATYRTIFARAGWHGVTTQAVRRQVARRLSERGADDKQVAAFLGLSHGRSVKRLLQHEPLPIENLVKDLV